MDAKFRRLLDTLIKQTKQGKALWEETGVRDQFALRLDKGTVLLDAFDNEMAFSLVILNDDGKRLDGIRLASWEGSDFDDLKDLYTTVFRRTLRVDETIDSVLDELEDLG